VHERYRQLRIRAGGKREWKEGRNRDQVPYQYFFLPLLELSVKLHNLLKTVVIGVIGVIGLTGLDRTDIANFRPVSNLTFMSKVVERAAASQLNAYLSANGLLPRHQ